MMSQEESRKSVENDVLREMFEKQISFQKLACGIDVPEDLPDKFYLQTTACIVELCEAIQTDNRWKVLIGGKRKEKNNNADKLDELVDAMHFLINAVLYSGFSYEEFVEAFKEKNIRNIKRQILKNE
jgi:hypothetical protein|nr:MAG TPA: NTP-PPase-like protein [Caudoviricetes sp.]